MKKMITAKELELLVNHILEDISFQSQGTFNIDNNGNYSFDHKEAKKVMKILAKLTKLVQDKV